MEIIGTQIVLLYSYLNCIAAVYNTRPAMPQGFRPTSKVSSRATFTKPKCHHHHHQQQQHLRHYFLVIIRLSYPEGLRDLKITPRIGI
jgi:hypothetical protein